jgi:hypothetical protein
MLTSEFPVFFKDKKAKSYRIIFVYALNSKLKCHTSIKKKKKKIKLSQTANGPVVSIPGQSNSIIW